ncbi:MAG: asparagine synthase-related protein, partial [Cyanobacteria bacterium J06629_18]
LPREIIQRPKSGMMVPVQYWFRNLWQRRGKSLLLSRKAEIAPYLNQDLILAKKVSLVNTEHHQIIQKNLDIFEIFLTN